MSWYLFMTVKTNSELIRESIVKIWSMFFPERDLQIYIDVRNTHLYYYFFYIYIIIRLNSKHNFDAENFFKIM